jgi:hypothetical protein
VTDWVFAAITADIVGSTEYYKANGTPLRPRLLEALGKVNARHAEALAVPFAITLGDEFQGLVADPADSPRVLYDLRLQLSPLKCRIGVGIGTIVSELAETTAQMEGAAFSMSREALDAAGKLKGGVTVYRTGREEVEAAANAVWLLIDAVQSRWTDKQWEAVRSYSELGELAKVGKALGISWQAVDYRLRPTRWRDVEDAVAALAGLVTRLLAGDSADQNSGTRL